MAVGVLAEGVVCAVAIVVAVGVRADSLVVTFGVDAG
jgi:hypothetical protein